ncbi:MAG: hypothetical protein H6732_03730 [Alphaproteobacteria bacterium]|nr:hypothetical protein [Alphaproteobacteria bacterium]
MDDTLARLRQQIREIEGGPVQQVRAAPSGLPGLDGLTGGLPCPGLVEVDGPVGGGRTRLVLGWAAQATQRGARVAWVDPAGSLYPPTAAALGVALERLLLVRPVEERLAWTADQLARSGCFGLVVLAALPDLRGVVARWREAVRQGRTTLVVLSDRPARLASVDLRLQVREGVAVVQRRRAGPVGRALALPPWPEGLDPLEGGGRSPWAVRAPGSGRGRSGAV